MFHFVCYILHIQKKYLTKKCKYDQHNNRKIPIKQNTMVVVFIY